MSNSERGDYNELMNGIVPKDETEVTSFLEEYSEYDGRGVIIGVFDTGIDPLAPGLDVFIDDYYSKIDIFNAFLYIENNRW